MLTGHAAQQRCNAEVWKYREAYAAPERHVAFLPAIMFTSGRIHGEFLHLLHILSHREARAPVARSGVTCLEEVALILLAS
jgi:hypothetical protein